MSSPYRSAAVPKSPALSAVLLLFTLATLLEVTSGELVCAQQSKPAVAAIVVAAASKDEDDDKDTKGDDDDDDFQQPVRVGDLIGRDVIAPLESQDFIGRVTKLVHDGDDIMIVMRIGGHFGFGTHLVCVPAESLALTGYALQAKDISPDDIAVLPPCDGSGNAPFDANATIKMALAKPAH